MILGHGEEQIALTVVFDLSKRTLVTLKKNWTLFDAQTKRREEGAD